MNIGDTELVAVQSRSLDKAKAFGESFNAAPYTDIATMIQQERIDVVVICTPHPAHREAYRYWLSKTAPMCWLKNHWPSASMMSDAMIAAGKAAGRQL